MTLKVVTFNGSSETFTFAGSGCIDKIADFKRGNINFTADFQILWNLVDTEFPNMFRGHLGWR